MNRRSFLLAPALSAVPTTSPAPSSVIAEAVAFGRAFDRVVALQPELDRIAAAGDFRATFAWQDEHHDPAVAEMLAADARLAKALKRAGLHGIRLDGRLYVVGGVGMFGPHCLDTIPEQTTVIELAKVAGTDNRGGA